MSARRAPQAPPDLPGFTYIDILGSGGFADVFLYEQHLPRRRVAVKVLLTERISSGSVAEFTAEANVMAMLSTHPAIVTIYQAGVAGDGRPYLVMEYCPKPNLQVRYRREPFSVAESLRVGIQVAGAVETAHRAGVLHRDIKPANILVTEYSRPALTDFGIASTTAAAGESAGLSIPWSPPESFADQPRSDRRSDVYALGATIYTLLAARSPFELNGQRNTAADLIHRIETTPVPALGRADTPPSLLHVLERSMAKSPADRYASALDFARALQKVQIELSHSVTPVDILDDGPTEDLEEEDGDDGLTRVRGVVSIDPETAPAAGRTRPATEPVAAALTTDWRPPVPTTSAAEETILRRPASPAASPAPGYAAEDVGETLRRSPQPSQADTAQRVPQSIAPAHTAGPVPPETPDDAGADPAVRRRSRAGLWTGIAAGVVLLAVVAIAAVALPGMLSGDAAPKPTTTPTATYVDPIAAAVAAPTDVVGTVQGDDVVFAWTNPDPQDGDAYAWAVETLGEEPRYEKVTEPTVTVAVQGEKTCITVMVVRSNGSASRETTGCAP